ncbi:MULTISPECIES: type II secretion system secretin GspD [Gammaproteobacteria]|uniref:type II secretion system secretin GspD n=1 Tax=Gammaproteobacteria TaxID=1236 RepID=UPI000DD0CD70|nr:MULTISPECIES: type II secretion system secretin GspD [Gammaproteobacteria]RTE86205.1 type II secretion system protein GspD [Aliidiomarina sp. B3213]TCZ91557.1 type II secretion system protein GspD [Lysobacter sp. N42]
MIFLKRIGIVCIAACVLSTPVFAQQGQASAQQEEFSASFRNTDLNEFIQVVSRNLEKTIIVDPEVRGRINVRSYDVMNREQYYQFFLSVLSVHGYAVIEMESGTLKVIRDRDAKNAPSPVVDEGQSEGDEWVTRVVPLQNVSVRELAPLLRQLNDQTSGGAVMHYDPSNVILITGRAAVVNRLVDIIRRVDRVGDQDVEIVQLEHASASEMVRIAESVFAQQGTNTPEMLRPRVVADERTNRILVSGEERARERVIRLIRQLDQEMETSGNTRVFYLRYAKSEEMVELLRGMTDTLIAEEQRAGSGTNTQQRRSGPEVSIESHEATNALVVTAQPDLLNAIESVIDQLDIRRAQVQVEAIIVEVFEGDGTDFGVQWLSEDYGMLQHSNGTQVPLGQLAVAAEQAQGREGSEVTRVDNAGNEFTTREPDERGDFTLLAQLLGNANGLLFGTVEDTWGAVVQAVATNTNSNILSAPSITTLDNQEAVFLVGQEVPTITGSTSGSNNNNPYQTVERTEVGIRLRVTPQINEGDAVQLLIEQEVSSIAGATAVDITFNKREIQTTVLARDGQTIVLGGLIDEDVQESLSKVPLLGDIPLIGHLFKSTSVSTRKRNLMIFIRPTIIRDDATMTGLSRRKYSFIRAQQLMQQDQGVSLRSRDVIPVIPNWPEGEPMPQELEEYMRERFEALDEAMENEGN